MRPERGRALAGMQVRRDGDATLLMHAARDSSASTKLADLCATPDESLRSKTVAVPVRAVHMREMTYSHRLQLLPLSHIERTVETRLELIRERDLLRPVGGNSRLKAGRRVVPREECIGAC